MKIGIALFDNEQTKEPTNMGDHNISTTRILCTDHCDLESQDKNSAGSETDISRRTECCDRCEEIVMSLCRKRCERKSSVLRSQGD